ncbi:hypothetical protein TIFTF001_054209, partial [Ficus carica]
MLADLRYLNLSNAGFVGQIPIDLSGLTGLVNLDLSTNFLLKLENPNLFMLIKNFSKLEELHLDGVDMSASGISASCMEYFPKRSSRLVISYTSFSGILPTSINNLKKLSLLELTENQFNGTLPNFMLPELVYLDLSMNNFTGPIPSFRMARNLMEIVLSHNGLTGAITLAHWEGLMKLVAVDLWNNSFSGSIPSSLFALPSLEEIRLSHNGFDGQLPEFTNPSSSLLAVLELSSNNLEGPIP